MYYIAIIQRLLIIISNTLPKYFICPVVIGLYMCLFVYDYIRMYKHHNQSFKEYW